VPAWRMTQRPGRSRRAAPAALLLPALLFGATPVRAEGPPITEFLEIADGGQRACDVAAAGGRKSAFMADGTACFIGPITRQSADEFLSLPIPDGAWLVVWSGGGDVASALDMAERILDRHLPVVVSRLCLSSCANYLFVAGAAKVVMPESVVHGHRAGAGCRPGPSWEPSGPAGASGPPPVRQGRGRSGAQWGRRRRTGGGQLPSPAMIRAGGGRRPCPFAQRPSPASLEPCDPR